jgi:hypothetical protein
MASIFHKEGHIEPNMTSLNPSPFNYRSCTKPLEWAVICLQGVSIVPVVGDFLLNFRIVLTVLYIFQLYSPFHTRFSVWRLEIGMCYIIYIFFRRVTVILLLRFLNTKWCTRVVICIQHVQASASQITNVFPEDMC